MVHHRKMYLKQRGSFKHQKFVQAISRASRSNVLVAYLTAELKLRIILNSS